MKNVHTRASSQNKTEEEDWNCLGLWTVSWDHSTTWPNLSRLLALAPLGLWHISRVGQGLPWQRGLHSCEGQSYLKPGMASEWSEGSHCWCLQRQSTWSGPELWLVLGPPQPAPWLMSSTHSGPSCSSTAPLWGKEADADVGESTHLKGMEPAWTWTSGLLLQQIGTCPHPQ